MHKSLKDKIMRKGTDKLTRIFRIICMLRSGHLLINCSELSKKFDVDRRTILRDIEFLNHDLVGLGVIVKYDRAEGTYKYPDGTSDKFEYLDILRGMASSKPSLSELKSFLEALDPSDLSLLLSSIGHPPVSSPLPHMSSGLMTFSLAEYSFPIPAASSRQRIDKLDFLIAPLKRLSHAELQSIVGSC